MHHQIRDSRYVLLVCTPQYKRRLEGDELLGKGQGVRFEGVLIGNYIYRAHMKNEKFIPVLGPNSTRENIPDLLLDFTSYAMNSDADRSALVARLLGKDSITALEDTTSSELPYEEDHVLHQFPRSPVVGAGIVPHRLILACVKVTGNGAKAQVAVEEAIRIRREADSGATVPILGDFPDPGQVPTSVYWQRVFGECRLHGPRMVASLLLAVDARQFTEDEMADRESVLHKLRSGNVQ